MVPATSNKVSTGDVYFSLKDADGLHSERYEVTFHGSINVDIREYDLVEFGFIYSEDPSEMTPFGEGTQKFVKRLVGNDFDYQTYMYKEDLDYTTYYYRAFILFNDKQYELGAVKKFGNLKTSSYGK